MHFRSIVTAAPRVSTQQWPPHHADGMTLLLTIRRSLRSHQRPPDACSCRLTFDQQPADHGCCAGSCRLQRGRLRHAGSVGAAADLGVAAPPAGSLRGEELTGPHDHLTSTLAAEPYMHAVGGMVALPVSEFRACSICSGIARIETGTCSEFIKRHRDQRADDVLSPRVQLVNLVALLAAWVTVFDTIAKEREMLERPEQDVYGGMEQGVAQGIPVRSWLPAVLACTPTAACCLDSQLEQGRHDLNTTAYGPSKAAFSPRHVVASVLGIQCRAPGSAASL